MFGGRFSSSIGSVGIDFGARSIRLLQVREHGGELRVVGAGLVDLPPSGLDTDAPEALGARIRAAFSSGGFAGRRCVVSMPRNDISLQSVRLPSMADDELRQAVTWEASQRFGFDRAAMQVEFIRTGATMQGAEGREEVLLIAAPHALINNCIDPVLAAGLRPQAIESHFTAIARAVSRFCRREEDVRQVRVVVDVGTQGSTVLMLRGNQIAFCKPLGIGGNQLDEAVAEHLQLDIQTARELRAARLAASTGAGVADEATERAVYEAVRPLLTAFVKEIVLCIRYYGVTFRGHPPERLILTGGDSLESRLDKALGERCKIPVDCQPEGLPLADIHKQIESIIHRNPGPAASWAVAAGLSLRGIAASRAVTSSGDDQSKQRRGAA